MKSLFLIALFIFILFAGKTEAQINGDSLYFMQTIEKAQKVFARQSYDSATFLYQTAYDWAVQKKMLNYYYASNCLLALGDCYLMRKNYARTHEYYYSALLNSRKYKHHAKLKNLATGALFTLHAYIQEHDIVFPYPVITNFTEQKVFFSISKILFQKGDSAVVEIDGGTYDGLLNGKNNNGDLFSTQDAVTKLGGDYSGSVQLIHRTPDKTTATVSLQNKNIIIKPGWQVKLLAQVPEAISRSGFNDAYRLNFNWQNNEGKLNIFNRRFLYYFGDEQMDEDVMDLFKQELKGVVNTWSADTINANSRFREPISDGIFKGKNIITALLESTTGAINYFIHFMIDYYTSYFGQQLKFSESYATWAFYGSQMKGKDISHFILGNENKSDEMIQRASSMMTQVERGNMISEWVDEGLELADKNYWRTLLSKSRLLYHYGKASNRNDCIAWSNFFDALRFRGNGFINRSDSFLTVSYKNFESAGSVEGMKWIQSVKTALLDTTIIHLQVPRQHTMPYDVYASPNQRYFATASKDFTVKIWDITLGKQIYTIDGHNDEVYDLAYNPGGRYLASISYDSTIKIWNSFSYNILNSFKPAIHQLSIKFSPDGKYLVSAGEDSTINFWDPFTGNRVRTFRAPGGYVQNFSFNPLEPSNMYLVCTDSAVYNYRLDTTSVKRILKSPDNYILSIFFSKDGQYLCYYKQDSSFYIFNAVSGTFVYSDKVYSWKTSGKLSFSSGEFSPDSKYFIYCRKDTNTVILDLNQVKTVGLYGPPVQQYSFNSNGSYYITTTNATPSIIDFSEFNFQKTYDEIYGNTKYANWQETFFQLKEKQFVSTSQALLETRFSADNKSLIYLSWGTHKLNLSNAKTELLSPYQHWMGGTHQYPANENLIVIRMPHSNDTLVIYSRQDNKIFGTFTIPDMEDIASFSFFENDRFCMLSGAKGSIACWDVQQRKLVYHKKNISGNNKALSSLLMQPGTNRMLVFGIKMKPLLINTNDGTVLDSINLSEADRGAFVKDKLFFTSAKGSVYYTDSSHLEPVYLSTIHSDNGNYFLDLKSSAKREFLYFLSDSTCSVLNTTSLQVVNRFFIDGKNLITLAVSADDSLVVAGSINGEFAIYKTGTGKMVGKVFLPTPNEAILTDDEGHYMASKEVLGSVVFNQGYKFYGYDQFDMQLNQPHRVLASLGIADTTTIQAYQQAYDKRLQRNGIQSGIVSPSKTPNIIILNRASFRPTTTNEFYTVEVQCYDNRYKITALKIFVNDVPFIDSTAWTMSDSTANIFTIKIPLTTGNNKIKIYCINQPGFSSSKEVFDVFCLSKNQKQSTWFIGLGVNHYQDSSNDLTYSVKDIRDMAKNFKKIYSDIIIDTLINNQVTLKNIELLKQRLKKVKVTDRIIMAVTGHGLLSDSLDFYYATYDINFKNPATRGLKYDDLENILNSTAARQRLLLIDACHSGMLDKETVYKNDGNFFDKDTISEKVKAKNVRGLIVNQKQKLSDANSFNLMQNLFADFSNDNGIIVISAAGGLEYAFESDKWRNGVFTYCILKGLIEKEADLEKYGGNDDRKISVQELMRYVSFKVPSLTGGKQQPASRRENIDFDWIVN